MGFPIPLLMEAYRDPKQNFATKVDPSKINSTIIFDTAGFDKWIAKRIKIQTAEFASQRRRPARGSRLENNKRGGINEKEYVYDEDFESDRFKTSSTDLYFWISKEEALAHARKKI